ncbi:hypothetical protein D6850_02980 [Roseovarius spongiae]|uniref:DUF2244 domain-containing protein n=1 Tax=Roseovarius spongiae TaxID=2320272 RepID=A0A3A8AZQ3_9RHOB|nr:hypothetical protein [Roseovarius spongiae]RKF16530.1 hypothetical protein D6850_02980 [Roseovarius spongiae]
MQDEILMTVRASWPRRFFALAILASLGGLLVCLAVLRPPAEWGLQVFLGAFGLLVLWAAELLRRATKEGLELTQEALRSTTGEILARVDEIEALERGVLAWKPSNGFLLRLSAAGPRRWEPGMWWRLGRRIGVGGVVSAPRTKAMAEILAAMIKGRDAPS